MDEQKNKLTVEESAKDRWYTTLCITGMTVDEINYILTGREKALGEVMEKYGEGNMFSVWSCGYGIYSIRHVGGHLFVMIGNNCD